MTTTPDGWLYLAPLGDGRALIQAMTPAPVPDPARHLASRPAATGFGEWLAREPEHVGVVPAAPWIAPHGAEPGRIPIGAALRLDPVNGSGAGHALRTAALVAAVIRGGLPAETALAHYTQRLRAAFHDHLGSRLSYSRAAFRTAAWDDELRATATARSATAEQLRDHRFRLTLHGDRLIPMAAACADERTRDGGDHRAA